MARRPPPTYIISALVPAAHLSVWIGQNYLQLQPFWPKIPWELMWAASCAFLAGLLLEDCITRGSWLRAYWEQLNQLFIVESVFEDQPPNEPIRREGVLMLRFVRDMSHAEMRLWGLTPNNASPFLVTHRTGMLCLKHSNLRVVVATVAIHDSAFGARFGETASGQSFHPGEIKKVVLDIHSGWRHQRYKVDVIVRPISASAHIELIPEEGLYRWAEP